MQNKPSTRLYFFIPFLIGAAIAAGIFIGYFLGGPQVELTAGGFKRLHDSDKLRDALQYIMHEYVDTLNEKTLEEDAIVALLEQLDPHSAYIPAAEAETMNEQLQGNFDGIGVEFNIRRDTIMVVSAISGGPSEALGIRSGDRIIAIEGESIAGVGVTNDDVMKKLRGERGTKVKVTIYRPSEKGNIDYNITRGQIPIYSLDARYMLNPTIGYIKISRFAATTYSEYLKAFNELRMKGMQKLVLDLRGNPGGYLNAAVDLCDEFLPGGRKIVYTEGQARKREDFVATAKGGFENGALVVLIDEGSASASEIVSGAVQDNDRGWVVGRRSFGKGLVQEEVRFDDGSAMRLTIARYYTPTGRCIQKPYTEGIEAYYNELNDRFVHGEMLSADSVNAFDTLAYKTPSGRKVYGGGGIMPDVFISIDTSDYSKYASEVISAGLLNRFAFDYVDSHRKALESKYKDADEFVRSFPIAQVMSEFTTFASKEGVPFRKEQYEQSSVWLSSQMLALLGRPLFGNDGFYSILNRNDRFVKKALELLEKNKLVTASQEANTKPTL
ncbi:MAG: PDZ domain-containing protein [Bacteroidetes bacterium]|nr:PDZ domain-containing protein [Bacteroidota bacterium]